MWAGSLVDIILIIGSCQDAAFRRLAELAPTLKEAELRVLLYLITIMDGQRTAVASSRQIAAATAVSRSNVKVALHTLRDRHILTTRDGSATQSSAYLLSFAATVPLRGGPTTGPPLDLLEDHPGPAAAPQVGLLQPHPGPDTGPPLIETAPLPPTSPAVDISIDPISDLFDRIHRAAPTHTDPELLAHAREWLCGYMRKFGRDPSHHPPDPTITARFLAVAPWPQLERVLYDLMAERTEPGHSYAWFIAVAVQRTYGISPQQQRQARAALRAVPRPGAAAPASDQLAPSDIDIAAIAARKAL